MILLSRPLCLVPALILVCGLFASRVLAPRVDFTPDFIGDIFTQDGDLHGLNVLQTDIDVEAKLDAGDKLQIITVTYRLQCPAEGDGLELHVIANSVRAFLNNNELALATFPAAVRTSPKDIRVGGSQFGERVRRSQDRIKSFYVPFGKSDQTLKLVFTRKNKEFYDEFVYVRDSSYFGIWLNPRLEKGSVNVSCKYPSDFVLDEYTFNSEPTSKEASYLITEQTAETSRFDHPAFERNPAIDSVIVNINRSTHAPNYNYDRVNTIRADVHLNKQAWSPVAIPIALLLILFVFALLSLLSWLRQKPPLGKIETPNHT